MKAMFVRMLLIAWPCVACLWPAASPPSFAQESKPEAKTPDIQGTWNLVSWERNGKDQKLQKVRIFITESRVYSEGLPLPDDKGRDAWHYELSPSDKPNAALLNLDGVQGRETVPALCALDGVTLRIVLGRNSKTPALPIKEDSVDRPKEFATKPGSDQVLLVLKRADAADDPISLIRKLGYSPTPTLGSIYLSGEQAKQAKNEDLAVIKKYPLIYALSLRGCQITDAGLIHLEDMANLEYLTLADMPITNEGLVHLENLPKLADLTVDCAKVSGAGLKRLTKLKALNLEGSAFTDADLAHLEGLTKLERLDLSNTAITDAGLVHVKPLVNLDRLSLDKTNVTDASLEHLHGLTKLRELSLKGTKVTDKGVKALQAAIPNVKIIVR